MGSRVVNAFGNMVYIVNFLNRNNFPFRLFSQFEIEGKNTFMKSLSQMLHLESPHLKTLHQRLMIVKGAVIFTWI